jgi:transposase
MRPERIREQFRLERQAKDMKKMTDITIGIDISKDVLDTASIPDGETEQFPNNKNGHKMLLKWVKIRKAKLIVFEPTSAYHRALEQMLAEQGLIYTKVNPYHAKRFGDATGKRAKTDRIDALMLARLGAVMQLEPSKHKGQHLVKLHEFLVARLALVKDKTAAKNRLHVQTLALLKRQLSNRIKQINKDIDAIDEACLKMIKADPALYNRLQILQSIPGIGINTAILLLTEMPELGTMDKRQTGALAGLAPVTRQSGQWKG